MINLRDFTTADGFNSIYILLNYDYKKQQPVLCLTIMAFAGSPLGEACKFYRQTKIRTTIDIDPHRTCPECTLERQ